MSKEELSNQASEPRATQAVRCAAAAGGGGVVGRDDRDRVGALGLEVEGIPSLDLAAGRHDGERGRVRAPERIGQGVGGGGGDGVAHVLARGGVLGDAAGQMTGLPGSPCAAQRATRT